MSVNVKCKYCQSKYRLTRAAYDDIEYLGQHVINCKHCNHSFGVVLNNFKPVAIKCESYVTH